MLSFIWMHITAPMKNEMSSTIPMESTPSDDISFKYCFTNMRILSGRENERPIRMMYRPSVFKYFNISIFCFCSLIPCKSNNKNMKTGQRA